MKSIPWSKADVEEMVQEGRRARHAMIEAGGEHGGFCPLDLGQWMDLCAQAGVPAVPAFSVATASTVDIWECAEPTANVTSAVIEFWNKVRTWQGTCGVGWMMRWSCCSCAEVKFRLSSGNSRWDPALMELLVDDFRAFDIIADYPLPTISAWARPWVQFAQCGSHPIEYRAFVSDGVLDGISNYYPQRSLPENDPSVQRDLRMVKLWTNLLITAQRKPTNLPRMAGMFDESKNQFTADFARLPDGAVVFLEGGPPHTSRWGAHPCCFPVDGISGVALEDRSGLYERGHEPADMSNSVEVPS